MSANNIAPWPCYDQEEARAVAAVLMSNKVNAWAGNECRHFEEEFASCFNTRHAITVANGSLALELILQSFDLEPGDEVIVTSRSFVASASSIVNAGAIPVFADVCRESGNITAETIAPLVSAKTRGLICVHLAGWPCDMAKINALAQQKNLFVIEDCAQAHGAKIGDISVGNFGDAAAWSFCQDKIMTTGGEGGMITINSAEQADRIRSLKDHGKNMAKVHTPNPTGSFRYVHDRFGTNARMTEMQAAIGRIQLKRLPGWSESRRRNARHIWQFAASLPAIRAPMPPESVLHAAYKCYLFVRPEMLHPEWNRDRIIAALNNAGVPCQSGSCSEIYLEASFVNAGLAPAVRRPVAKSLGETSLMFPIHPTLSQSSIDWFDSTLEEVICHATR